MKTEVINRINKTVIHSLRQRQSEMNSHSTHAYEVKELLTSFDWR